MTCAYDRIYLEKARSSLGAMLDYAVYDLNYDLKEFWEIFLASSVCTSFENGDVSVIAGRSGIELALIVTGKEKDYPPYSFSQERSEEYWLGWALAYFQWSTCMSFFQITEFIPIEDILKMYSPYHEMDIRQFVDALKEIYVKCKQQTNLKRRRLSIGLSQSQLSAQTGIPVRTIQQYEQRQKSINKASGEYLLALSHALYCKVEHLLEINNNLQ